MHCTYEILGKPLSIVKPQFPLLSKGDASSSYSEGVGGFSVIMPRKHRAWGGQREACVVGPAAGSEA